MSRIGRYIINGLTGLSVLISGAAMLLWARSGTHCDHAVVTRVADRVERTDLFGRPWRPGWRLELVSLNGGIGFEWTPFEGRWLSAAAPGLDLWRKSERIHDGGWANPKTAYPGASRGVKQGLTANDGRGTWAWRWHGFLAIKNRAPSPPEVAATVPHWAVASLAALLPAARIVKRQIRALVRRRRARTRRCVACGYDLRATTTGVCPECGEETTAQ